MKNTRKFLRSKRYLALLNDFCHRPFYTYTTEMSLEEAHRRFPMENCILSDGHIVGIEVYRPMKIEVII